jgi:hypothetical protein
MFIHVYKVHQPYSPSFTLSTYPSPPTSTLLPTGPALHFILHLSVYSWFKRFHNGISPMNKLYFNQFLCLALSLCLLLFIAFSAFHYAFFLHRCNVFQYYSLFIILSSSSSSPPQIVPLLETCCTCGGGGGICICIIQM